MWNFTGLPSSPICRKCRVGKFAPPRSEEWCRGRQVRREIASFAPMAPYPTYQAACTPTQAFLTACKIWLIVSGCYFVKLIRTEKTQYDNTKIFSAAGCPPRTPASHSSCSPSTAAWRPPGCGQVGCKTPSRDQDPPEVLKKNMLLAMTNSEGFGLK